MGELKRIVSEISVAGGEIKSRVNLIRSNVRQERGPAVRGDFPRRIDLAENVALFVSQFRVKGTHELCVFRFPADTFEIAWINLVERSEISAPECSVPRRVEIFDRPVFHFQMRAETFCTPVTETEPVFRFRRDFIVQLPCEDCRAVPECFCHFLRDPS